MALTGGERLQAWLFRACMAVFYALFWLLSPRRGAPRKLPPVHNPLLTLSALQLARKIRRREVTSVEVVQAYVERIQEVNPLLNAMVKDRFCEALQEASQVDRLVEESVEVGVLEEKLPLLGVPLSVKEAFGLQGMPQSTGLVWRRGVLSAAEAPPVTLLKRAGAIPLGVTNSSELCMWSESHNRVYGITNNPYDLERIPGGSSGGEGSLLGGAGAVIGVGSDIGGSIRMPCFFSGVFGHKTTPGVVSNENQYPPASGCQDDYLSTGPMCRYAGDLLPMLRIMAGPNAHMLSLSEEVDLRKLRFFTVPHDGGNSPLTSPVDRQLILAQRRVVERLEADLGVRVQEVGFAGLKYSFQIWDTFMGLPDKEGKPPQPFAELMGEPGKPVWPVWELLKWMMGRSTHTMPAIGLALVEMSHSAQPSPFILQQKAALQKEMEELLGTDGVLLYPTHPHLAPKHHHPLFTPFDFAYTGVLNILGLPVTQCPLGLSAEGLPLGVQAVAGRLQDRLPLALAAYLEEAFGGWRDPGAH